MNAERHDLQATSLALLSLGTLLTRGFNPDEDRWVTDVPILAIALDSTTFDAGGWAAEYHRVFIREVHPFANVFFSSDAQMGGLWTQWVQEQILRLGLHIQTGSDEPDHLGHLIITLGHLVGAEQDAVEDGVHTAVVGLQTLQAQWIDDYLTPWLHLLRMAVRQQNAPFYGDLVDLVIELVCTRRRRLDVPFKPSRPLVLPPLIADLSHPKTDIRAIATQLTTPALSGWYLSRGWLSLTGAQLDLPCGFGSRRLMLTNLFHTAIDHRAMPALCDHLIQVADQWAQSFDEASQRPCPGWAHVGTIWNARLESTRQLLIALRDASTHVDLDDRCGQ